MGPLRISFPGDRIVIGRTRRLRNERREQPMSPGIGSEYMVVPIHGAEIGIDIPALTDEFDAGNIVLLMGVLQRRIERDGLSIDGFDPRHFEVFWIVHPYAQFYVRHGTSTHRPP